MTAEPEPVEYSVLADAGDLPDHVRVVVCPWCADLVRPSGWARHAARHAPRSAA